MVLKDTHDTLEEIPEQYRELFTEKGGKFECTGIQGMKTSADVARVQTGLEKERGEHLATKEKLSTWGDLDHAEVVKKLDRIEELEAASGGDVDPAKLDEMANKRAEGIVKTQIAPLNRKIESLEKLNGTLTDTNTTLTGKENSRSREDLLRPMLIDAKVLAEHHEDAFMYAEKHLERTESGWIVKEGATGVTAGAIAKDWLTEMLEKRPGWLPPSIGGGARGSGGGGGFSGAGANPWSHEGWNMTKQGDYLREHGREKAVAAAKSQGVDIDKPTKPAAKK
tara:strand:- start:31774 stop:32616 length:843 start_codon:yes stop_codon:yes gene_type:complete